MQKEKKKFYQRLWFLWLCLIVVPPVGLIILWIFHEKMKKVSQIILSIVFMLWSILYVAALASVIIDTTTNNEKIEVEGEMSQSETKQLIENSNISENETMMSNDSWIREIEEAIQNDIGEGEIITEVRCDNKDLHIYVDFSQCDPSPLTYEELAESRTSSITDRILKFTQYDDFWDIVTVDFGDVGYIRNGKDNIVESEYGRYFEPLNFELITGEI